MPRGCITMLSFSKRQSSRNERLLAENIPVIHKDGRSAAYSGDPGDVLGSITRGDVFGSTGVYSTNCTIPCVDSNFNFRLIPSVHQQKFEDFASLDGLYFLCNYRDQKASFMSTHSSIYPLSPTISPHLPPFRSSPTSLNISPFPFVTVLFSSLALSRPRKLSARMLSSILPLTTPTASSAS